MISPDRAINRISLEVRKCLATLAELRNLSSRKSDVGARHNIAAAKNLEFVDRPVSPTRV
jgi:hypothetical protein